MATHKWTLTLDFECVSEQGYGPEPANNTKISISGHHDTNNKGIVPVNECVALDMENLLAMLIEGASIVGTSTMKESAKAFMAAAEDRLLHHCEVANERDGYLIHDTDVFRRLTRAQGTRVRMAFHRAGVNTFHAASKMSRDEFRELKSCGRGTVTRIAQFLLDNGVYLLGEGNAEEKTHTTEGPREANRTGEARADRSDVPASVSRETTRTNHRGDS